VLLIVATPVPAQVPKATPEQVGFSPQRLKRLTEVFQAYVADRKLAGSVVLVARRGKIAYLHAFGQRDREANSPMPEDAIFRIASQTKALVSVGVMILQEQGKLLIGDAVGKYLPEFQKTTVAVPKKDGGYPSPYVTSLPTPRALAMEKGSPVIAGRLQGFRDGTSRIVMSPLVPRFPAWRRCRSMPSPAKAGSTATPLTFWELSSNASVAKR